MWSDISKLIAYGNECVDENELLSMEIAIIEDMFDDSDGIFNAVTVSVTVDVTPLKSCKSELTTILVEGNVESTQAPKSIREIIIYIPAGFITQ